MASMARKKTQRSAADVVRITDPKAIRALAHPARITIIDALYGGEELTATQCAGLTGLSASAASYHLRALDRWGLVRRAEVTGDGRERPWRAAGKYLEVDSLAAGSGPLTDSIQALLDRDRKAVGTFLAGRKSEPEPWRDALSLVSARVWLTPHEADLVVETLRAAVDGYRDRAEPSLRPSGSRPVRVSLAVVPLGQPGNDA
jgi:DNA-binding transcriptional ArsR family regulator